jgi:hypothetical protein
MLVSIAAHVKTDALSAQSKRSMVSVLLIPISVFHAEHVLQPARLMLPVKSDFFKILEKTAGTLVSAMFL